MAIFLLLYGWKISANFLPQLRCIVEKEDVQNSFASRKIQQEFPSRVKEKITTFAYRLSLSPFSFSRSLYSGIF